jgi:hypothetical protein
MKVFSQGAAQAVESAAREAAKMGSRPTSSPANSLLIQTMISPIIAALDLERQFSNNPCSNESSIIDAIDLERAIPNIPRSLSPSFCFNKVKAAASENDKQRKLRDFRRRLIFRKSQTRLFSSPIDDSPSPPDL